MNVVFKCHFFIFTAAHHLRLLSLQIHAYTCINMCLHAMRLYGRCVGRENIFMIGHGQAHRERERCVERDVLVLSLVSSRPCQAAKDASREMCVDYRYSI